MISFGGYVNQSEIIPPCTINSRIQQREKSWIPSKNHHLHYTRYIALNLHTHKTEEAEISKGIESNYENKEKEIAGLAMY